MANDTNHLKEELLKEKALLESELGELGRVIDEKTNDWEAVPEVLDESTADENTNADRFEDFEERSSTLVALETRWKNINIALEKIEQGTYGTCEKCGAEIESDRLGANPAARTCKAHMNE